MNPAVPLPLEEMDPKGATVHNGDVATTPEMMPAVGSTSEHSGNDDDEVWDRSSRSGRVVSTVTLLTPLQTPLAFGGATACDEFGELGDRECPEGKP